MNLKVPKNWCPRKYILWWVLVSVQRTISVVASFTLFFQRSRDSGGDSDLSIKQQLSSLYYVLKLIDSKLSKMENTDLDTGIFFDRS